MNFLSRLFKKLFPPEIEEEQDIMKYLIVGLGNMGAEYDNTRHNVGFDVVDYLARKYEVSFKQEQHGDLAEFKFKGRTFVLLKPSTFMNLSGKAVRFWGQKKKILPENLLVVVDDLNLPYGKMRLRSKGNDGGHNGLKSINEVLNTSGYSRLRIGIGNSFSQGRQVDFVLGEWSAEEQEGLEEILKKASEAVIAYGTIGVSRAMTQYNK